MMSGQNAFPAAKSHDVQTASASSVAHPVLSVILNPSSQRNDPVLLAHVGFLPKLGQNALPAVKLHEWHTALASRVALSFFGRGQLARLDILATLTLPDMQEALLTSHTWVAGQNALLSKSHW
jgi:hypothetical protein